MAAKYQEVRVSKGCDGNFYCAGDYVGEFSGTHLAFERERGNLIELEYRGEAKSLFEIPDGALVSFGAGIPKLWRRKINLA